MTVKEKITFPQFTLKMKLVALSFCLVIVLWDHTRLQAHAPTQCLVDPSTYASDSLRKLWETLRRRSQNLAILASQRMLFNPTKTFCFLYVYFTAKFHVPSELELKKRSLEEFSGTQGSCGSCWENTVKRLQIWDLKFAYARQLIKYLRGLHTSRSTTRSHARHTARSPALVQTWMDQSEHFNCFLRKPVRDKLVPGLPRALHH